MVRSLRRRLQTTDKDGVLHEPRRRATTDERAHNSDEAHPLEGRDPQGHQTGQLTATWERCIEGLRLWC